MELFFTQMDPPPPSVVGVLQEKGWNPIHLPMRRESISGFEAIDSKGFEAILITSKRGVRWLLQGPLPPTPVAVVGETSAALLLPQARLFEHAPANALELARALRQRFDSGSRFLWLRGARAKDTLKQELEGYHLTERVVYETLKIPQKITTLPEPSMVYFQAPSTVVDFRECFGEQPKWIGAIGPTTAEALRRIGWMPHFQPSRPENVIFAAELPPSSTMTGF